MGLLKPLSPFPDEKVVSSPLDPQTTLTQVRKLLKEDFITGDEIFIDPEQKGFITKSQEDIKAIQGFKTGDVAKIIMRKLPPKITTKEENKEEILSFNHIMLEYTESIIDIKELSMDDLKNLLDKCSYLYGSTLSSNLNVKLGTSPFFEDVPENQKFNKSAFKAVDGFFEKSKVTQGKEIHELYQKGFIDADIEESAQSIVSFGKIIPI